MLPGTTCDVYADINEIVHYHAAVLGVTGTGKTELSLDLIRASVAQGCKVVCVDFTGEYAKRLADLIPLELGLTADLGREYEDAIFAVETGNYGAGAEKAALKTFVDRIRPLIEDQVNSFLSGSGSLAILELAEITNTKATLRTTELFLSAFMSWAKANRRKKRILLVLEEAHTIVPETGGSGMDFESKWVVDRIGQIALQGRKYGIGLLVVSQRTALVSKTILSQCNTFFVFCLVDQTSLNFLTSVLSSEHVSGICNLQNLEMISYGRAISSERPLLVKRKFDAAKVLAAARLDSVVDANEAYWHAEFRLKEWMKDAWPEWDEEILDTPEEFEGTSACPICNQDFLVLSHPQGPHCFYCDCAVDAEECEDCGTTHLRASGCAYCNGRNGVD
jgi:DNA helicase HerA-like ATPase